MAQVIWTEAALSQLREIVQYIRKRSPANAESVRARLVEAPKILQQLPEFRARVPEYDEEHIREILVKPFRVIYVLQGETCIVARIYRGTRDLRIALNPEDLKDL